MVSVVTVVLRSAIYVLHAFQKKSPHGMEIARVDQELIRARLAWARQLDAKHLKDGEEHEHG